MALSIGTAQIGQTGLFSAIHRARDSGNSDRNKTNVLLFSSIRVETSDSEASLWRNSSAARSRSRRASSRLVITVPIGSLRASAYRAPAAALKRAASNSRPITVSVGEPSVLARLPRALPICQSSRSSSALDLLPHGATAVYKEVPGGVGTVQHETQHDFQRT
jgi:hypothetical protein